jgi:hypothetical protein
MPDAHNTKVKLHTIRGAGCTVYVSVYADGTVTLDTLSQYIDLTQAAQRRLIQILQECTTGLPNHGAPKDTVNGQEN